MAEHEGVLPATEEVERARELFGLGPAPTRRDVILAWKDAARLAHPDLAAPENTYAAERLMQRINESRQVLLAALPPEPDEPAPDYFAEAGLYDPLWFADSGSGPHADTAYEPPKGGLARVDESRADPVKGGTERVAEPTGRAVVTPNMVGDPTVVLPPVPPRPPSPPMPPMPPMPPRPAVRRTGMRFDVGNGTNGSPTRSVRQAQSVVSHANGSRPHPTPPPAPVVNSDTAREERTPTLVLVFVVAGVAIAIAVALLAWLAAAGAVG